MSKKENQIVPNNSFTEFLIYTTPNGKVEVEIFLKDENIWLTQERISELFGVQRPAITKHLKNIFEFSELKEESVSSILEHTARDGKNTKPSSIIWMPLFQWGTGSTPNRQRNSGFGQPNG